MDQTFLNEIISKKKEITTKNNLKKINKNQTLKIESNNEYLSIGDEDFDILNKITKKTFKIEEDVKLILIDSKNNIERLEDIKLLSNNIITNTNKNTNKNSKELIYLGIFVFISQIIIISVNNYLILNIFN